MPGLRARREAGRDVVSGDIARATVIAPEVGRAPLWRRAVRSIRIGGPLLLATFLWAASPATVAAQPVRGEVSATTRDGFTRLVFHLAEDVEPDVRFANGILVISFKKPVDIAVDRLSQLAPGYVSAARRDPDGTAVRLALSRRVTVNSMAAGERLFVDLLPETWKGLPPGLPQDVVEELARRAREAERKIRIQEQLARQKRMEPIRVRVGSHPTFTRYVFDLPGPVPVSVDRRGDTLALKFESLLNFDFADVHAALPPTVAQVMAESTENDVTVHFTFLGKVDVRTFREENAFVVDVAGISGDGGSFAPRAEPATVPPALKASEAAPPKEKHAAAAPPATAPPATAPATEAPKAANAAASANPAPAPPAAATAPAGDAVAGAGTAADTPKTNGAGATAEAAPPASSNAVMATLRRQGDTLRILLPFSTPTAAAVFRRADALWIVVDSAVPIDVSGLTGETSGTIRHATVARSGGGQVVRLRLARPRLLSTATENNTWTIILGDTVVEPTRPLTIGRNSVAQGRPTVSIPFDEPSKLHKLEDPDVGDHLLVVTGGGPARGLLNSHDFVEFRALASTHGVVVQPLADDIHAELVPDKVVISRPGGLTLSAPMIGTRRRNGPGPMLFDSQAWAENRKAEFNRRQAELTRIAAEASESTRAPARLELARFYMAREYYPEAKGVLDATIADQRPNAENPAPLVMRAIASLMMYRPEDALEDLNNPAVGNQHDALVWRALAHARQGKWGDAHAGFRMAAASVGTLPVELQRAYLKEAVRASIEVKAFGDASEQMTELEMLGIPRELQPAMNVLSGRLAEGMGKTMDALAAYRAAAESGDRAAAAQGRLREMVLRQALGDLKPKEAIAELEQLTATWRGDETEVEALQLLAHLYTEEGRFRDAFYVMKTALAAHPDSTFTRRIHEEAAQTFSTLFLSAKGDDIPPIEALSLFYDFRELTPIGRRGDEMIRRLADRLVAVDLLEQAAELLQHQVDHRLEGAARAQVAARLATIYLMDRKPDRAVQVLRATRVANLSNQLRNRRLLLEARALSDTGRHDLALEVAANLQGREVDLLRADVLWAARRWREAAEAIEKLYGDRWNDFAPLTAAERADVMRAAIGYALGEDALGMERFRGRYAGKMADGPDARAFEVITAPMGTESAEFGDVAREVSAIDTLNGFLRELRARYPDSEPPAPEAEAAPAAPAPQPADGAGAALNSERQRTAQAR